MTNTSARGPHAGLRYAFGIKVGNIIPRRERNRVWRYVVDSVRVEDDAVFVKASVPGMITRQNRDFTFTATCLVEVYGEQ